MKKKEIPIDTNDNFLKLKKRYGEDAFNLVENLSVIENKIQLSILSLNKIIGGGIPIGRIIELFGAESTGKTTLALQIIADFQRKGLNCALLDLERCYYPELGEKLGIDNKKLYIAKPLYGEDAFQMIIDYAEMLQVKLIVLDSVAALSSKDEIIDNSNAIGTQARMMSKWIRRIVPVISQNNVTVIFINQLRKQVGNPYANPETTTGGMALRFFSTLRIELKRTAYLKDKDDVIVGSEIRVKSHKNKLTNPFQNTRLKIYNGYGFSVIADIVDLAEKYNIIEKNGSWYNYKTNSLGQGLDKVFEVLKNDPKTLKAIRDEVLKIMEKDEIEETTQNKS